MYRYDIKKIMRGLFINETKVPVIRIELVMDCIPEEMQNTVETELSTFEEKVKGVVLAVVNEIPTPKTPSPDTKNIMRGFGVNDTQVPAIRLNLLMECIPAEIQSAVEAELRIFEEKLKGVVLEATNATPGVKFYPV